MNTNETCSLIRSFHRERVFFMKQRMRIYASLGAYLRVVYGWNPDLPKKEAENIRKRAADLIECGHKEMAGKPHALMDSAEYQDHKFKIAATIHAAAVFENGEKIAEKENIRLAKTLPVWSHFAEGVKGFGASSLATIVGEAGGDLGTYKHFSLLWKRLGIACIKGRAQGRLPKGSDAEEWVEHGYSKERRSRMFVVGDVLIKVNGDGPYRAIYDRRKEYERARAADAGLTVAPAAKIPAKRASEFMSDGHVHRRAQRYMETKFIRDLWKAWRRAESGVAASPTPAPVVKMRKARAPVKAPQRLIAARSIRSITNAIDDRHV